MIDPITCCLLGLCCPPGSPEQLAAFEQALTAQIGEEKAKHVAKQLQKDLIAFSKKLKKAVEA